MLTLFVISCAVISINETYWGSYTPLMKNTAECCGTDDGYKFKKFIGQSEKTNNDPNKSKYLRNVIAFYKDETNHVVRIIYSKCQEATVISWWFCGLLVYTTCKKEKANLPWDAFHLHHRMYNKMIQSTLFNHLKIKLWHLTKTWMITPC